MSTAIDPEDLARSPATWSDVIFGHEQCRNPRCPTRRNTEGAPPSP